MTLAGPVGGSEIVVGPGEVNMSDHAEESEIRVGLAVASVITAGPDGAVASALDRTAGRSATITAVDQGAVGGTVGTPTIDVGLERLVTQIAATTTIFM